MKTQIIRLEVHDDIISTRDKMGWGQTGRILLVWPNQGRVLNRYLDLLLLQRHSNDLGAQLALVCREAGVRGYARQLGIPVFDTLREAHETRWRTRRPHRRRSLRKAPRPDFQQLRDQLPPRPAAWTNHPVVRLLIFSLSLLAILSITALILPEARLTLVPKEKDQVIILPVSASSQFVEANISGELPAYWTNIVVEGREAISATGTVMVPEKAATGSVRFTNLTEEVITIPPGTLVSTLGPDIIRFATTQQGKVVAGAGQLIDIPVVAANPGKAGNLPASAIQAVEGPLGLQLTVYNPYATRNGSDLPAPGPSQKDFDLLYQRLESTLEKTAWQELQGNPASQLAAGDYPITGTLQLANVVEKTYLPLLDQPGDELTLILRLEFRALVVARQTLQAYATPLMDAILPDGYIPVADSQTIEPITRPRFTDNVAAWQIRVSRRLQAKIDAEQVIASAVGTPSEQAPQKIAAALPVDGLPVVQLNPQWWPYLPFLPFRIQVEIQ